MKPLALNMSKMKKVGGDKNHSVFLHPQGHKIVIAHGPLSALQKKQIEKMPVHKMAEGGDPNSSSLDDTADSAPPVTSQPDEPLAKQIGSGVRTALDYAGDIGPLGVFKAAKALAGSDTAKDLYSGFTGSDAQASEATPSQSGPAPAAVQAPQSPGQPKPVMPASYPDGGLEQAYKQGLQSIQEQQKVSSDLSKSNASALEDDQKQRQDLIEDAKHNLGEYQNHAEQFINDYANNHINPNTYVENMSVPGRVSEAIGLILGGAGAHSNGGVNLASEYLDKQIERNIEAQKSRQEQQKTLIGVNRQLYGDQQIAENQTRINMNDMLAHEFQLQAAKLGTPQAKAAADQAAAEFKMKNIPLLQQNAIRTTVFKNLQSSGGKGVSAIDLGHAGIMSPEEATKEQASVDAQNSAISQIKRLYSNLGHQQTLGNRLANPIQSGSNIDALNAEITNAVMGADVSKRLTPESAKLEVLPFHVNLKDSPEVVRNKMSGVLDLVKQHNAGLTPNMQRYAPGSLPDYSSAVQNSLEGKTASDSKGNRIVMKNGQWVPYGG